MRVAWEARFNLPDDEADEWLDELHRRGSGVALTHGEWRRLLALARRLDLIPNDDWIDL